MTAASKIPVPAWFTGSPQRWRRLSLDWAFISKGMLWISRLRLACALAALAGLVFSTLAFALWETLPEAASACSGLAVFGLLLSAILPLASRSFSQKLASRRAQSLRFCSSLISQGAISEPLLPHPVQRRTLEALVFEAFSRSQAAALITSARATDPSGRSIELDILPPR